MNNKEVFNDTLNLQLPNQAMSSYEERITVDRMQFIHLSEEEKHMDYREERKKDDEIRQKQLQAVKKRLAQPALITGYRFSATGVFGYAFYKGQEKVCVVSSLVGPSAPVRIAGRTRSWEGVSCGDDETECISRVIDLTDQHEAFNVVTTEENNYQIWLKDEEFPVPDHWDVTIENERYRFCFPSVDRWHEPWMVASLERITTADWIPDIPGMDVEPRFLAKVYDDYDEFEEVLLAILSFPLLKA